jgi:hypothetical protein
MAIAISQMSAGIYQYMQTINAWWRPPFAAILWVGLLWKRTNGAGAIAAIITGFAVGSGQGCRISLGHALLVLSVRKPGPDLPAAFGSGLYCRHFDPSLPTPGTQENPVTFWNSVKLCARGWATAGIIAWCCGQACR